MPARASPGHLAPATARRSRLATRVVRRPRAWRLGLVGGARQYERKHVAGSQVQLVVGGGGVSADPGIDLSSQTWLHNVFHCPLHQDVCVDLGGLAGIADLVESGISVPGSADGDKQVSRASPCLLRLLRQWYDVIWLLRRAGFTLRGNFSRDNFAVYHPPIRRTGGAPGLGRARLRRRNRRAALERLVVRMTGRLHLSLYSPEDAVEDDRTFVWCVREVLNIRQHVPPEISDWLRLINSRGVGNEYLVRYHISLMDPRAGLSVLMSYRRRIEYLRRHKPDIYASILHYMAPYSQILRFTNTLMEAARLHGRNQSNKTQEEEEEEEEDGFDRSLRGIMTVVRNCSEHPANRFEKYMLLILDEDLRGFAAELHWVMFRTGQLQFLHLENTMG